MPLPFRQRLRDAVRAEAESYRRRNLTPLYARLSIGPNQALVSRVLKAADDDPVWGEFERRMRERHAGLETMTPLWLQSAVLEVWQEVENEPGKERER